MKYDPIFLQPAFQERLWGGTKLRERFGYDIPSDHTAEAWVVSAHPNGPSTVTSGDYAGYTLADLWKEHPDLFGDPVDETFPLLVKIIDAQQNLSVQVHPDDAFASEHEYDDRGKTECWYVLDCEPGAELIYGHYATSHEQLKQMMDDGAWEQLLRKVEIEPGDFIYIPSGTLHAIPAGTLIVETQQNSDTTYRVYDYDRTDENGNTRELHLESALDVIQVPHEDPQLPKPEPSRRGDATFTPLIESDYFTVDKWELDGAAELDQDHDFLLVNILEGEGRIHANGQDFTFKKGDHFILPSGVGKFDAEGQAMGLFSHP